MKTPSLLLLATAMLVAGIPQVSSAQTATPPAPVKKPAVKTATKTGAAHTAAKPAAPAQTWPAEDGLYAAFDTTQGRIVVKFYEKESPVTVKNFTQLARGLKESEDPKTHARVKRPFYDGLIFHRVIPDFMIQGGDPTGTGTGSGGIAPIIDEFDPSLKFDQKGRLAMANAGPHTGSCQFFITDSTPTHLNGHHTIFGQVVEGQDIVTKIAAVPRDASDKPTTPVVMKHVYIHRVGADPAAKTAPKPAAKTGAKPAVKAAPKAGV